MICLKKLFLLICCYIIKHCLNWIYVYIYHLLIRSDFYFWKYFQSNWTLGKITTLWCLVLDMVHFFSLSHGTKPSNLNGFKILWNSRDKESMKNLLWFYRIFLVKTITHNELNWSKLLYDVHSYENSQPGHQ